MSQRKRPAPSQSRPPRNNTTAVESSRLHRPQDGYAAPSPEDRADAEFLAEAKQRGYRLALACLDCGHPIVAAASLRRHRGPRCAARVVGK